MKKGNLLRSVIVMFVFIFGLSAVIFLMPTKESSENSKDVSLAVVDKISFDDPEPYIPGLEEIPNVTIHHTNGVEIPKWCFFPVSNEQGWYCNIMSLVGSNGKMDWETRRLTLYKSLGHEGDDQIFREYLIRDRVKQEKYLRIAESYLRQECGWVPADFEMIF